MQIWLNSNYYFSSENWPLNVVSPVNPNRKSATTIQTERFYIVGIYHQSNSACLLLQIQNHLTKIYDSMREQADIITVIEVFEKRWHNQLNSSISSSQGNIKHVTDNEKNKCRWQDATLSDSNSVQEDLEPKLAYSLSVKFSMCFFMHSRMILANVFTTIRSAQIFVQLQDDCASSEC